MLLEYGAGNARSAGFALERLGVAYSVESNPVDDADGSILPGVGAAPSARRALEKNGWWSWREETRRGRRSGDSKLCRSRFRIIPAIDLIGGRGVRLEQGDFSKETVYALNPVEQALKFERMGLRDLHLVDLDGVRSKRLEHQDILRSVSEATSLHLDYGGGVRNEEDIELLLSLGASKVVLGSAAARHSEWFVKSLELIGSKNLAFSCYIRNKKL